MEKIINKYLKIIFLITIISSVISAQDEAIVLSINNVNEINRTFDIYYTSPVDIYGFQFEVSGITIENVSSNLDGMLNFGSNTVLGFSVGQDLIAPAGSGVLVSITYQFSLENTNICVSNVVVGGPGGVSYESSAGNCQDLTFVGITISFDEVEIESSEEDTIRVLNINYESNISINGFELVFI